MKARAKVLQAGLYSTIQDLGRRGFQGYGVPFSGVMDRYAIRTANLLLQNHIDDAVLEITLTGPRLQFSAPTMIAMSGADLLPIINGVTREHHQVIQIQAGDILTFQRLQKGCRAYLAIAGGFQTEKVLESRSWYAGITSSARLEKDMELPYHPFQEQLPPTYASMRVEEDYLDAPELVVFPGPEFHHLSPELQEQLFSRSFSISTHNNRMAVQLKENFPNSLARIITGPVLPGTIQLTPGGNLIVLMLDCQTTGGYPRVLQCSEKAINTLAQKKTGEEVHFVLNLEKKLEK